TSADRKTGGRASASGYRQPVGHHSGQCPVAGDRARRAAHTGADRDHSPGGGKKLGTESAAAGVGALVALFAIWKAQQRCYRMIFFMASMSRVLIAAADH